MMEHTQVGNGASAPAGICPGCSRPKGKEHIIASRETRGEPGTGDRWAYEDLVSGKYRFVYPEIQHTEDGGWTTGNPELDRSLLEIARIALEVAERETRDSRADEAH